MAEGRQIEALEDAERLADRRPAGLVRQQNQLCVSIAHHQRVHDSRRKFCEILDGQNPTERLHVARNALGGLAAVEPIGSVVGNAPQGAGQVRLLELRCWLAECRSRWYAVRQEDARRLSVAPNHAQFRRDQHPLVPVDREAFLSKPDCRRERLGQIARAEALQCGGHAVHHARCGDRQRSVGICLVLDAAEADTRRSEALGELVHIGTGLAGGAAEIVDHGTLTRGHLDRHEAAAAETAHPRLDNRHAERSGDRCVHSISASVEHVEGRIDSPWVLRGNHLARRDRQIARDIQ